MRGVNDYAVVYDISSDLERGRVDRILKDYGFRVQKSVFECRLKKQERTELIGKLEELNIKTGFIKLYRLEFATRQVSIGVRNGADIDGGSAFII